MRSLALATIVAVCALVCLGAGVQAQSSPQPYNTSLASQLLHMSGAAYCSVQAVEDWSCSFCKEVPNFIPYGVQYNETTDMLSFVGYQTDLDAIVITFRGTSLTSILDWVEDLNFFAVPAICPGCEVHEGFLGAYYSVRDATVQFVHDITAKYPNSSVIVTGHSLGGALAYLAAVDLALNEGITTDTMYTFGQPRVGNKIFVDAWKDLFYENSTSYRVTHGLDPVPHVPPQLVGFNHPPTEVYYDGLNLGHKVCDGSGEDPTCADQWLLPLGVSDHVTYLGLDFVAEWLKCNL